MNYNKPKLNSIILSELNPKILYILRNAILKYYIFDRNESQQ